jgi:predicted CxxxxCH...CXXCH cytochrome family protein
LEGRTDAEQDEATIDTTSGAWIFGTEWNDGSNTCTNMCHDPSEAGTTSASWGSTMAGCDSCHQSTNMTTGSHTAHRIAQPVYGNNYQCQDCHVNNGGNDDHMTGAVILAMATTVTYDGNLVAPYGTPYGSCLTTTCHSDGQGNAVATSVWGTSITDPNCGICHQFPPLNGQHAIHMANTYVQGNPNKCRECHANIWPQDHLSGTVDDVGTSNVAYSTTDDNCTNDCHLADDTNEWTSGSLNCTDCHAATYVGSAPSTGLHDGASLTNVLAHDDSFDAGYGCESCHVGPDPSGVDHIDGALEDPGTATFSWAGSVSGYDQADGCAAACHDDGGKWSRRWIGVVDASKNGSNPGDGVCDNCHGDGMTGAAVDAGTTGWRVGVVPVHQTDWDGDTDREVLDPTSNHSTCQACHGWGNANYTSTWGSDHGNGSITMNGPSGVGAEYSASAFNCAAACHSGEQHDAQHDPRVEFAVHLQLRQLSFP